MIPNPWKISLYDPSSLILGDAFNYLGDVWAPESLKVTLRHNDTSTAVIGVALSDAIAQTLMTDGVRCKIWRNGELLLTGTLDGFSVNGPSFKGQLEATFISDFAVLHQLISNPYGNGTQGTDPKKYWKSSGAAETVVKDLVSQNSAYWGASYISVAPVHATPQGSSIDLNTRYEELYSAIFPQVEASGIGLSFIHDGTKIVMDTYVVADYPRTLDEDSGMVADWSFSSAAPTATEVISGGSYTVSGQPDVFVQAVVSDTTTVWGTRVSYKAADGGNYGDTQAQIQANCQSTATATLADLSLKSGISIKLTQTGQLQYGQATGLLIGKRVTIALAGVTRTDILREVDFTFDTNAGDQMVPVVGDIANDPDTNIAAYLSALKRGLKRLEVKTT